MAETTVAKERTGIELRIYNDFSGPRSDRGIGVEGTIKVDKETDFTEVVGALQNKVASGTIIVPDAQKRSIKMRQPYRFDTGLPIPKTDEEAQELYSVTLEDLIKMGVDKLSYDRDTQIGNEITADLENGVDFGKLEDVSKYEKALEDNMKETPERTPSKKKELTKKANQLDALMAKFETSSVEELMAIMSKKVAKK